MKSLRCLAEFLSYLGTAQTTLEQRQHEFSRACSNPSEFYKQLARNRTQGLTKDDIKLFIEGFGYNLQEPRIDGSNYRILQKQAKKHALLDQALDLLLREYSTEGAMSFADFSWLVLGNHDNVVYRSGSATFDSKETLFRLLEAELQNLLTIQAFKRIVVEETTNLDEAYQTICSKNGGMTGDAITTLLNVNGIFPSYPAERIISRLKGEPSLQEFKKYFTIRAAAKQTKIYYSNVKKTALNESNVSFGTPNKRTFMTQASTSKKVPLVLSEIKVKEFSEQAKPVNSLAVLEDIAAEEKQFQRKKQKLLLNPDLDFELLYEHLVEQFEPLLKQQYKDASFTSFLRFLLPSNTWQHQYLGFIRYNINARVAAQSIELVRSLLKEHHQKQQRVQSLWKRTEGQGQQRSQLFKSISIDARRINRQDLSRHFPQQSVRLLLDRMDKLQAGHIDLQRFS